MSWEELFNKELTPEQKRLARNFIQFFLAIFAGATTVLSYTNAYIYPRSEANILIKQIDENKHNLEKNYEVILKRLDKLEERLTLGGDNNNKELLSRIQSIDNNINRRIDLLYEKLLERRGR